MQFAQAFMALRRDAGEAGQPGLRQEAVVFQGKVVSYCDLPAFGPVPAVVRRRAEECVAQKYLAQRSVWLARLSFPLREEAMRDINTHVKLQYRLQALGYIPAADRLDGLYGPSTRAAIAAWQSNNQREATGVLTNDDSVQLLQPAASGEQETVPASLPLPAPRRAPTDPRSLAIIQAEAEKAKAEAEKAQAEADRARADADAEAIRERARLAAEQKLNAQRRAFNDASGVQP